MRERRKNAKRMFNFHAGPSILLGNSTFEITGAICESNLYVLSRKRRTHREHVRRSLNLCRLLDRRGVQLRFHSSHPINRPACRNGYSLYLITGLRRIGLSPVDHVAAYQPARILPSYRFLRKVV